MSEQTDRYETTVSTPSDTEVRTERIFDAPRDLVWECYIDPDLLSEWLGPRSLKMRIEEYDVREGGSYRYVHSDDEGNEYVFFGEFLEIREPEFIVQTFNFVMEPPIPPAIDRSDFEDLGDGRTRIVTTSKFESKDLRDGMIQSGMETGVVEGYAQLDELLERRQA
ncbi:MAG: SRPBCC family protein [Actinomycetota bacterium]|nr:SRPBCC family protein [Actinomycetota bacterium]